MKKGNAKKPNKVRFSQNSVSFGKTSGKSGQMPAFPLNSRVAFPKTEVLGKAQVPAKTAGTKTASKKKRLKELTLRDRLRALLVAGLVVLVAAVSSLTVIYIHAVRTQPLQQMAAAYVGHPAPAEEAEAATPPAPVPPIHPPGVREQAPVPAPEVRPARAVLPPAPEPRPDVTTPMRDTPVAPGSRGALVFVIDDAGNNLRDLEPFLNFPGSLTIAVLPGLPYSAEAARRIRAAGKELFLHQPMESIGGTNPGPGAIMAGMDRDEIREVINRNLDELGPVAGMNNHEGSRITMDEEAMKTILALSRERGIHFLDSRTTAETAAPSVARQLGMAIGERDIFLDNLQDRESIMYFMNRGLSRAQQRGWAIMIGHAWSPELAPLLKEMYAVLIEQGYSFSSVAEIITQNQ